MADPMGKQVKLIIEGEKDNSEHVDLGTFLTAISAFKSALGDADKSIYKGMGDSKFLVTDLSHSSPAALTVEPVPPSIHNDKTQNVLNYFYDVMVGISSGNIPEVSDFDILEHLKKLSKPVGAKITSLTVVVGERVCDITKDFYRNVDKALESSETCYGSIDGYLEQINIHGENKFFTIYPDVGPDKVKCVFPKEIHSVAVNCIEKRVTVSGELKYRARANFPYEISVNNIDILPSDEELPTFGDLLGIIPDFEKDKLSEETIRNLRDEWN